MKGLCSLCSKMTQVVEAHLSPEAGIFQLQFQSSVDVLVTLGINLALQTPPGAAHLFYTGNPRIVAMLQFFPERSTRLQAMIPRRVMKP